MKILNLHGFMGEADNKNCRALRSSVPEEDIISPELKYKEIAPDKLLDQLAAMIDTDDVLFVGQSLGGWYADKLSRRFNRPCILTNPCYFPHDLKLITESGIKEEFVEMYRALSESGCNDRAYTLCSDHDMILPDNYGACCTHSHMVTRVQGSHSTIQDLDIHLSAMLTEINSDRLLMFTGRGAAFADEHNSALFAQNNELVLIDCPATAYQKIKKMNWQQYDNIYILITHTHGDHCGGVGTMLQHVWFVSGMKKKVTIVAPSGEVRDDLLMLLTRIEGCEREWFDIITADELKKDWFRTAVPTTHVKPLEGRCFGYQLEIQGKNAVYTGDTATLEPFIPLLENGSFLYTEAAYYKSGVHLYLADTMPELIRLTENGIRVYLMHLDAEAEIRNMVKDTPLRLAELI